MPPTSYAESTRLRDELIPALYEARSYVEVGRVRQPEVRGGLLRALSATHSLADDDRKYVSLVNRLRVAVEEADALTRER